MTLFEWHMARMALYCTVQILHYYCVDKAPCLLIHPVFLHCLSLKYFSAVINQHSVSILSELPYMILPHKKNKTIHVVCKKLFTAFLWYKRYSHVTALLQSHLLLRHPGVTTAACEEKLVLTSAVQCKTRSLGKHVLHSTI